MKILILYPHDIANLKTHGSGQKLFNFMKYFSQVGHKLYLAGFDNNISKNLKQELLNYTELILEKPVTGIKKRFNPFSLILFKKLNYLIYSKNLEKKINKIIKIAKPDIVHIEFTAMGEYVYNLTPGSYKKILFNDEVVLRKMLKEKQYTKNIFRKIWLSLQIPIIKKYEINLCKQFNLVLTITAEEKKFLQPYLPETNIEVSTMGVDIDLFRAKTQSHQKFNLLFIGNYKHKPNYQTAIYLSKKIFPVIKKRVNSAKLYLVGPNPPTSIKNKDIKITGFTNNISKYYHLADVFIAPIKTGGGLRIKILEAMAMAKAVITTSLGAEGIKCEHKKNIIIADNKKQIINNIIELHQNPELKNKIGIQARMNIDKNYNWQDIYQKLEQKYQELISSTFLR